jgi:hypothetical protein
MTQPFDAAPRGAHRDRAGRAWLLFRFGNWFARKWASLVLVQTNCKPTANQPQTNPEVSGAQVLRSLDALDRRPGSKRGNSGRRRTLATVRRGRTVAHTRLRPLWPRIDLFGTRPGPHPGFVSFHPTPPWTPLRRIRGESPSFPGKRGGLCVSPPWSALQRIGHDPGQAPGPGPGAGELWRAGGVSPLLREPWRRPGTKGLR